jgi:UDP-N-acetylmuramyl tripeptide synthase
MDALQDRVALIFGRFAGQIVRLRRKEGATALPGLVGGLISKKLLYSLSQNMADGVVTISGTNGKTTTTNFLNLILENAGFNTLTNTAGSNLERGLISAYTDAVNAWGGYPKNKQQVGLFEVDEAELARTFNQLNPRVSTFLNLFRDQLDRYGEVDNLALRWQDMIKAKGEYGSIVINVDDPNICRLQECTTGEVITFGIEDDNLKIEDLYNVKDARFCARGSVLKYDNLYMSHLGQWRCDCCTVFRPKPKVRAQNISLKNGSSGFDLVIDDIRHKIIINMPGLYVVYNALAAAATAYALEVDIDLIASSLNAVKPPQGRQEIFLVDQKEIRILLTKNPTGFNETIKIIMPDSESIEVNLLAILNDGIQDGEDVSWIYDADIERLKKYNIDLVCSGIRANDFALRWHLAGINPRLVCSNIEESLDRALDNVPLGGRLDVIATYTAMLQIRSILVSRSRKADYEII